MAERKRTTPRKRRTTASSINLLQAADDPRLFRDWFTRGDWSNWFAFLAALFALPMDDVQFATYQKCTGRKYEPDQPFNDAFLICGRRAGKSFLLALIAVFVATFVDHRRYLAPGERGVIMIVAADRKQAGIILRYVKALLTEVPMLKRMIAAERAEGIDLTNRISIEVFTSSLKSVRGWTIVCALLDELAFWASEDSTEPDFEVINAIRPGMSTIPGAMMLCASSPYARRGALYDAWVKHFGKDDSDTLVWQADTRTMNPSIPQSFIDNEVKRDAAAAAAEYGAQFRSDISSFISRDAVMACVSAGIRERPARDEITYVAFTDAAGGSGRDSFTLAIAHRDGDAIVLDAVREIAPPFSPTAAVAELAIVMKEYRLFQVVGDRYAGEWPREQFVKHGIEYKPSERTRSDLYLNFLPLLNSARVKLLDHDKLIQQIVGLERKTGRGSDHIDHGPNGHDDISNAAAGAVVLLSLPKYRYDVSLDWVGAPTTQEEKAQWRRMALQAHIMGGRDLTWLI